MKLRLARKIIKAVGTDYCPYNEYQIHKAMDRIQKTQSYKDDEAFWKALVVDYRLLEGLN